MEKGKEEEAQLRDPTLAIKRWDYQRARPFTVGDSERMLRRFLTNAQPARDTISARFIMMIRV